MLKKPAAERLKLLRNSEGAQGQFLWAILRNAFHYAAVHLATHCRQRPRCGPVHALGLWHAAGPVRAVAGGGLAGSGQDGPGRHRCRQSPVQRAAARLGVQRPGGRARRCAHSRKAAWNPTHRRVRRRRAACPCTRASTSPRACWVPMRRVPRRQAPRCIEDDAIRLWTLDARTSADCQHQDQDARHRPRRGRGPGARRRTLAETGLPRFGDLVARRACSLPVPICRPCCPPS